MQNSDTALRLWIAASAFCILLSGTLGCAARSSGSDAGALNRLRSDIFAATRQPGVTRASWSVVVDSLDRHDRLVDLNSGTLFVPASVAKLVSVATAADAVSWDYRFETTLLTTGSVSQGRLFGDLVIVGSGDPSIGGRGGGDLSAFVAAVKAAGFERIEGRIVGDDDALEEPRPQLSWAWDDLGYPTGALFGALNLGENRTAVTLSPGPEPGKPAVVSLDPRVTLRPILNRTVTVPAGSSGRSSDPASRR
jgi:serine-type D-Ala-D-Ala carboxypeptidase/endopeptidase (penicillin-binding protein 4)